MPHMHTHRLSDASPVAMYVCVTFVLQVQDLVMKQETIEVKCEFCGQQYRLPHQDVAKELDLKPPE